MLANYKKIPQSLITLCEWPNFPHMINYLQLPRSAGNKNNKYWLLKLNKHDIALLCSLTMGNWDTSIKFQYLIDESEKPTTK